MMHRNLDLLMMNREFVQLVLKILQQPLKLHLDL